MTDGGEMGRVWGNLWRVAELREWLNQRRDLCVRSRRNGF